VRWRTAHRHRARTERRNHRFLKQLEAALAKVVFETLERIVVKHMAASVAVAAVGPAIAKEMARSGELDRITDELIAERTAALAAPSS
jgi:hypothetical protein